MVTVKFYLDSKADKIKLYPIHLVIRQKELQVKVSTGEKLKKKDWDHKNQIVKESEYRHKSMNKFLSFIKLEVEKVIESTPHTKLTSKKIKTKIQELVESRRSNINTKIVEEVAEYSVGKDKISFIDLQK